MLHRIASVGVCGGLLLATVLVTRPADAHGALENPLSRAAACGAQSPLASGSEACRAALAVGGTALPEEWDNLRVADVAGRDRDTIPDGQLCSGGLPQFKGLDLPRADWPTTTLTSGADFTFKYRGTIPHQGTFRMYVTTDGYDPAEPLKWSDLESTPFLESTDPKLANGSYAIEGRLPTGRTGRHLIYTIWQNSDTPDTYYSCSDVIFAASSETSGAPAASDAPAPSEGEVVPGAQSGAATGTQAEDPGSAAVTPSSAVGGVPMMLGVAGLVMAGAGAAITLIARSNRRRRR